MLKSAEKAWIRCEFSVGATNVCESCIIQFQCASQAAFRAWILHLLGDGVRDADPACSRQPRKALKEDS